MAGSSCVIKVRTTGLHTINAFGLLRQCHFVHMISDKRHLISFCRSVSVVLPGR